MPKEAQVQYQWAVDEGEIRDLSTEGSTGSSGPEWVKDISKGNKC